MMVSALNLAWAGPVPSTVLAAVAQRYQVTVEELCSPRRHAHLVVARREVARLLRRQGLTLKEIGYHLGGRDHSTIHHSLNGRAS